MDYTNRSIYNKIKLTNFILSTNFNTKYKLFAEENGFLKPHLLNLDEKDFFTFTSVLNYYSYCGYFALEAREKITNWILEPKGNLSNLLDNMNILGLEEERLAQKLWHDKCLYDCAKVEYKYLVQCRKELNLKNKIIDFRSTIRIGNDLEYDLFHILKQIIKNNNILNDREEAWVRKNYNQELVYITNYLEEQTFQQVK